MKKVEFICQVWFLYINLFVMSCSELLCVRGHISANWTPKRELLPIWWMFYFKRTFWYAWALWQLAWLLSWHIITGALSLVAWLAKVCISPTEPLRDVAAELTLELDEVCSVYFAFSISHSQCIGSTLTANQFFSLKLLLFLLGPETIL